MARAKTENAPNYIIGFLAIFASIYFLFHQRNDLSIVFASIYFILICFTDTLKSKIPNIMSALLIIAGILLNTYTLGYSGAFKSLSGLALGIGLLLVPYLMGGFGAGDVKALGALGALIGPYDILQVFIYMAFFGGGFAVLHYVLLSDIKQNAKRAWGSIQTSFLTHGIRPLLPSKRQEQKESLRFPYAAAIAFGYFSFIVWGSPLKALNI